MFNRAMSLLPSTRIRRRLASGLLNRQEHASGLLGNRQSGNREAVGGRRSEQVNSVENYHFTEKNLFREGQSRTRAKCGKVKKRKLDGVVVGLKTGCLWRGQRTNVVPK